MFFLLIDRDLREHEFCSMNIEIHSDRSFYICLFTSLIIFFTFLTRCFFSGTTTNVLVCTTEKNSGIYEWISTCVGEIPTNWNSYWKWMVLRKTSIKSHYDKTDGKFCFVSTPHDRIAFKTSKSQLSIYPPAIGVLRSLESICSKSPSLIILIHINILNCPIS